MSDNIPNQPTKFRTKIWVEVNDRARGKYNTYIEAYILVSGTITITGAGADDAGKWEDERNKGVIFKSCAPFTGCISEINNTQIDNAKDIAVEMLIYNLIEYSNNYSQTSGSIKYQHKDL